MDQLVATMSSFASSFDAGYESTVNNKPATTDVEEGVGYEIIIDNVGHVCKVQEEHGRRHTDMNNDNSTPLNYDSLVSTVKNLHTSLLDVLTLSTCDTAAAGCTQLVNADDERSCGAGGPLWVADFEIPCVVRVTQRKKKKTHIDGEEWARLRRRLRQAEQSDGAKQREAQFTSELDLYLFNQDSIQWCESSDVEDTVPQMIDVKSSCRSDFGARSLSEEFIVLQ